MVEKRRQMAKAVFRHAHHPEQSRRGVNIHLKRLDSGVGGIPDSDPGRNDGPGRLWPSYWTVNV